MEMNADLPHGATPLDPDESADLIPSLSTLTELNEFEAANIARAMLTAPKLRLIRSNLLSERALRQLHPEMFGDTWRWAGKFRKTEKNIGMVPW